VPFGKIPVCSPGRPNPVTDIGSRKPGTSLARACERKKIRIKSLKPHDSGSEEQE
jgi:hypothetical protein